MYPLEHILLLVPTRNELALLLEQPAVGRLVARGLRAEACGFGLVASGLLSARLLAQHQPAAVIHAGIAGSLLENQPLGMAREFGSVVCDGIGIGAGDNYRPAEDSGWRPFASLGADDPGPLLELGWNGTSPGSAGLVSVCSASASDEERQVRRARFPNAVAEDMESWSVAMAARLAGVPVRVIRGLSNLAGDRDLPGWKIAAALASVARLVAAAVEEPGNG